MTTDNTDNYFDLLSDDDIVEEELHATKEREERAAAVATLEEKYADRGLKFTAGFEGNIPVVAYGVMDGLPFYFRYRGDVGRLSLGEADPQAEIKKYIHDLESALGQAEKALETGEDIWSTYVSMKTPDKDRLYPVFIKKHAVIPEFLGKPMNSFLDYDGLIGLFTALVDTLEDVNIDLI